MHRKLFGSDGTFRAGPEDDHFNPLSTEMVTTLGSDVMVSKTEAINRHVYDEALALFLCAPQALYAVNRHVHFDPYKTTVDDRHWLRANADSTADRSASAQARSSQKKSSGYSGASC